MEFFWDENSRIKIPKWDPSQLSSELDSIAASVSVLFELGLTNNKQTNKITRDKIDFAAEEQHLRGQEVLRPAVQYLMIHHLKTFKSFCYSVRSARSKRLYGFRRKKNPTGQITFLISPL